MPTHGGRLLLVLMAVAVLRERMPLADLLTAMHRLLEPLRRCGVDTDRGLVRLLLVLNYIETMPRPRDWRLLLDAPAAALARYSNSLIAAREARLPDHRPALAASCRSSISGRA
jgi:hypothetical protein